MADDIFDQVAAQPASTTGDIFDQVAKAPAAPAAPQQATPDIDTSHPAGATAPLGAPAAHPAVDMKQSSIDFDAPGPDMKQAAIDTAKAATGYGNVESAVKGAYDAGKQIVTGGKDIFDAAAQDFKNSGGNPLVKLPDDVAKQNRDKALGGAAKLIAGGGTVAMAIEAPTVLGLAEKAIAGDAVAKIAIAKIAAGVAAGTGSSAAGGAVADKYNLSPGAKDLVQSVAFFLPSLLGLAAGVKTDIRPDAQGNPAASVEAFGGKVKAGGVATPESFKAGIKVGDTRAGVEIPRNQPAPPPPDPARIFEAQNTDAGTNAIVRAATKEQQAKTVVAGGPPPPPPGPPMPDSMKAGVITPETVQNIASSIHIAPPEQHPQLLMEAHGKLTEYIQKQGRIIGPDGKLAIAETPAAAAKLAQTIINDEVDRQSQAKEDDAKAQADALKEAQKTATTPGEDGALSPADKQWQRAKTLIESTTLQPGQKMESVLQRNLAVGYGTAKQMTDRYAQETAAAQLPTLGSKKEPVVEESKATVDAQLGALSRGDTKVVMLPQGSRYMPELPKGMKMMSVDGDAPGAGKYIYDPTKIKAATIKTAAKAGTHGDLLGHVQTKEDLAAQPGKPTVVVQAQDKSGTPIQDSEVHPERAHQQIEAMQERHPDAKVVVKPTEQVINERLAEQDKEEPAKEEAEGDIFDEVAKTPEQRKTEAKAKIPHPDSSEAYKGLKKSLHSIEGAEGRWDKLRETGASDDELKAAIGKEFGEQRSSNGPIEHSTKGGENPRYWAGDMNWGQSSKEKGLSGAKLLKQAREILDIGQPGEGRPSEADDEVAKSEETKGGRGESPEPVAAEPTKPAAPEQRKDVARRKAVNEMSTEDLRKELLTSSTVDLPNKRAFDEAQASEPAKAVAMSDADGLKALNDKFGYEAGNELLRAKAAALKEAGLDAYHDKGDEFLYRGDSKADIAKKLDDAREILRNRIIQVTTNDGSELKFSGADFSFGTGDDLNAAESRLKEHKSEREARGERARGELRGITQVEPERSEVDKGSAPAVAKPEPIKKGDLVTAKDIKGKDQTGKVAFTDGRVTRIKTAADKEITVKTSTVTRATDHSKPTQAQVEEMARQSAEHKQQESDAIKRVEKVIGELKGGKENLAKLRQQRDGHGLNDHQYLEALKGMPIGPKGREAAKLYTPETSVATTPAGEDNNSDEPGDDNSGAGLEASSDGGGDRAALAERPAEVLRPSDEGERAEVASKADSPDVRERVAAVPTKGTAPGSGQGSDSGIDSAPGLAETEKATKALTKVVKLNRDWFSHPANFAVPPGEMGKLDANIRAIELLREVEKTPRKLTDEEKNELAQYAGWGSLPNVFNVYGIRDHQRQMRYREAARKLMAMLSPEEMAAAERSTQNAHFTSPEVVRWMWDIAKRIGFKGGTVLEPSMGSGNFLGMMPANVRGAVSAIGNELDPLTYAIAKQLYPSAQLYNKDFVDLIMADNSVDFAIGNVPFGVKIHDPKYPKLKAQIHDYFFIKSLDKVRPGGIVSYITSTGSMDKGDRAIRELLASRADLVAAFRLPSDAFKATAGTAVTTDLMIFRKRAPGQKPGGEQFINSVEMPIANKDGKIANIKVNEYFHAHPDNMLGKPVADSMYSGRDESFSLEAHPDKNMKDLLDQALRRVPVGNMDVSSLGSKQADTAAVYAPENLQEGQFVVQKDKLLQRTQGKLVPPPSVVDKFGVPSLRKIQRIKAMVGLRDQMNGLLTMMKENPNDDKNNAIIAMQRDALKKSYDAFVKANGLLNAPANAVFEDDPHYPRLLALESYDRATKVSTPADIFTKRTIFPRESLANISPDAGEALQQILGESGFPDVNLIAQLQGKPPAEVAKALIDRNLIYQDPLSGKYETPTNYLSGYVRDKLADAEAAVKQGLKQYQRNVDALTKALPPTIPVKEINIRLGQTWIPTKAISDFVQDVMNTPAKVTNVNGVWKVQFDRNTVESTTLYGTPKAYADQLMEDSLNQRQTSINFPPDTDGKSTLDVDSTNAARAMQTKIAEAFTKYAVEHKTYGPQFEQLYNYAYNNLVRAEHDGSHLKFPGMVKEMHGKPFQLQAHQINVAWQFLQEGRGFAAHTVGAGKTFATIASIMESRRLGLGKKHMVAVPNHLVGQWRKEWMALYPGATLLVPTKDDFNAKNRNKIMAKIATGDFDAVILPHSQFNLMDISAERQEKTMQGEMDELNETIKALEQQEGSKSRTVKQMAKARESLRTKMAKLKDLKADKTINFDELGVDKLYVDEAHEYKNLSFYTKMQRVSGLGQSASKKGTRLLMKTQYLQDMHNGRGVHFLSGTPVQNTMAELYTQNKYVAPDVLQKAGIKFFDDWAANFGEAITNMELSADGRSYKARTKFAQFVNVPELMQMFRSFTDVKMKDDLNLPTPKVKNGGQTVMTVEASNDVDEYVKGLMDRALAVSGQKGARPDPREDNMLKITSDGRKAATDMRLVSKAYKDDPDSKINQAIEEILRTHRETRETKSTQAVFLDMYRAFNEEPPPTITPEGISIAKKPTVRLNLYEDMRDKLIAKGVPKSEIAIITEAKTKEDKQRLFDKMNSGELRILFGSTQKMGAGMNAQKKMIRLHNLDLPWRPGDLEQRIGRIERQGNENEEVEVSNYLTTKSFDAYMAQTLQTKAAFIHQVIGGKYKGRTMIDAAGPQVMAMEEMKIAASGDPNVKKKFELERKLTQLQSLERSYESSRFSTRMRIADATSDVARLNGRLAAVDAAADKYKAIVGKGEEKGFALDVDGQKFTDRETAFDYLKAMTLPPGNFYLTMMGQGISVTQRETNFANKDGSRDWIMEYNLPYTEGTMYPSPKMTMESLGLSIESRLRSLPDMPAEMRESMATAQARATKLKEISENGKFDQADELKELTKELAKVNSALGIGNDLDGKLALTTGVTAEADNTGETADEAEEAEEDNDLEKTDDEDETPAKTGTTLRSSVFGLDLLADFMGDQGKKLWEKEIAPHIPTAVETFKKAVQQTTALLYPRIGANEDALDSMFQSKGEREKHRFMLDRMEGGLEKFFDKMPEEARLAFIDRYKLGVGQLDPALQKIEDLMRSIDKASFDRAKEYKPSMTAKEDHYRVLWKTIPDPNGTHANQTEKRPVGVGRRPFEGDKGFMKRSTLDTISEGISYGGVPVSTNPWKMFTLAQSSIMQYITAQDHWADLKGLGLRKFVRPGTQRPEGWVKLDDRIAKAFFPAEVLTKDIDDLPSWSRGKGKAAREYVAKEDVETRHAYIPVGEWYLEPTAGRILNNYLSRDLVRENAIGNVLMAAKNLSTAIELGLSPFHFGFETVEAIGSQFGLGVQRFWNNGVRLGQGAEAVKGLKEIATSIAAPVLTARAGGNMLKMVDNPTAFAQTKRGAGFLKQYPDAPRLLDELFTGGYQWGMNPDYKFDPAKSMQEVMTDKNYGGAMLRLIPWVNHVVMAPLFEHYIPRLKLGFALAQYSQQLAENSVALSNGDTTRAKLARQVIDTAENRFGEMNFSNILWNNTFKSVAQFLFRSITWKLGNWRGAATAAGPEAYHAFKDPIQQMIDDAKSGTSRSKGEYLPKLGMNQAWLVGMMAATAVLGTVLTKIWTGNYPWQFLDEDKGSTGGNLLLEMAHPRTGQHDMKTGKPERISLPTGFKDFEHGYLHPREYLRGSLSGTAGNFVDLLENRDFFNNYVYDPNAPLYQQVSEAVKYSLPKPIAASALTDHHGGQDAKTKALKFAGLAPTARERDLSPAEQRMQEIRRARMTPLTPQQVKDREDEDAVGKKPTVRSMHAALKKGHEEYVQREFQNMSYADAREVYYHLASPAEQRILKPLMDKKRMALLHRNPDAVRRADAQ